MSVTAVFLDRDGTIIESRGYLADPDQVRLLPGAAEAVKRFAAAGHLVVVISNQSGIARGLLDEADLARVHERLERLLAKEGARLDGAYYCPYLAGAEAKIEAYRRDSELRKPRPGMLLQAAQELGIDLASSWMIGNSLSDVQAGYAAGCQTVLIDDGTCPWGDQLPQGTAVMRSIAEACRKIVPEPASQLSERNTAISANQGAQADAATSELDDVVRLLADIRDRIERAQRQERQHDFSILRLIGALLQMVAIVSGGWGVLALLNEVYEPASARILMACFFQIASLSAFVIDRFR